MVKEIIRFLQSLLRYKEGDTQGNMPSPRTSLTWADVSYDKTNSVLIVRSLLSEVACVTVQNTNSMEPLMDVGHQMIQCNAPEEIAQVSVGSIIVWSKITGYSGGTIHQIVSIDKDAQGWYCMTKGINNTVRDAEKVRRADIRWVVMGVIWTTGEGYYKEKVGD